MHRHRFLSRFNGYACTQPPTECRTRKYLTVALYPVMPRVAQFKSVVERAWARLEPCVPILWRDEWDGGYWQDPMPEYDVISFDALFLTHYNNMGWLHHIPVRDIDDFGDFQGYAAEGVLAGDKALGVPQLGCTTVLFHRADDGAMNEAVTLDEVVAALGEHTYCSRIPEGRVGLMTDFSNDSISAGFYLQSLQCDRHRLPRDLPFTVDEADPYIMDCIRRVLATSCHEDAYYQAPSFYRRAFWFGRGHGRAYIDYSESLSAIPADQYGDIAFKVMPWASNRAGINAPVFYTDVLGVHTATAERGTTELAVKLANLMGSVQVIEDSLEGWRGMGPQYLTPARNSVFDTLSARYPVYDRMREMMDSIDPVIFDAGPDGRRWFDAMQAALNGEFRRMSRSMSERAAQGKGPVSRLRRPALEEVLA